MGEAMIQLVGLDENRNGDVAPALRNPRRSKSKQRGAFVSSADSKAWAVARG
jgi:hypothetical protein